MSHKYYHISKTTSVTTFFLERRTEKKSLDFALSKQVKSILHELEKKDTGIGFLF